MSRIRNILLVAGLALDANRATAADVPYSFELSALAQRYYRLCQAEARLQENITRAFNEQHLPIPPTTSFLESLPVANRRDAQLVCLGAANQRLEDMEHPLATVVPSDVAVSQPARTSAEASSPHQQPSADAHDTQPTPRPKDAKKIHVGTIRHEKLHTIRPATPRQTLKAAELTRATPLVISRPARRVIISLDPPVSPRSK